MNEQQLINEWVVLQKEYDTICSEMMLENKTELKEKVIQLSQKMHSTMCEINKLPNNIEIIEQTRILTFRKVN